MNTKKIIFILTSIFCVATVAKADTAAGQKVANVCLACHGAQGISGNDLWPNLAGQKKDYIIKQLTAFHDGERKDPMMSPLASTLSKEDIQNVAAYFSSLSSK